ncbi:insulin receptor-related protein-like [Schistocerca gregaria]|uniref:insulin receptor-related protein-like n=1 Tax=Schistocerca gregaria TaxID=7010 RepID=UPI00211DF149|nr:insulin receptor-related protein-like [Schistocerca gregaria]XP_049841437.1 insulin receptor-related protein-like [Schistocerca gregaria]
MGRDCSACLVRQTSWAMLVVGVVVLLRAGATPEPPPPPPPTPPPTPAPTLPAPLTNHTGICGSVDARNNVTELKRKLQGCRVIEGFLHVVLMDNTNETSFLNVSFPELREITSYLLVHRVKGLQSLGALFPNLAVIRGQVLWVDHGYIRYSLMIYQLEDLKEVALASLTSVLRGAVRIGKVPQLCYAHTVDWEAIVASKEIYIDAPECGPEREPCPESSCNSTRCWGPRLCQRAGEPRWCDHSGACRRCHPQCLGGCDGPGPDACFACRGVLHDGRCVPSCPSTGELRFEFIGRRCVSEEQCRREPLPPGGNKVPGITWIPFQGRCRLECPEDHQMVGAPSGYAVCVPCRGRCRKVCGDGRESVVRTLADMDKFRQCTHVDGSLTFILSDDEHDLSEELPSRFGLIQEINGHLKVTRSFGLRSLDFLRNLRVIHGGDSADKPALVVMSNDNLQALWDWGRRGPDPEFSIRRGGLLFHDNPRLCLAEIERLRDVAQMDDFTVHDVSPVSNGYLASCGRVSFDAEARPLNETAAEVRWDRGGVTERLPGVIGYVLHYSVASDAGGAGSAVQQNTDECHTDGWKMEFAMLPLRERRAVLSGLRPHTRYEFYVRAYFSDSVRDGSRSAVRHFSTPAGRPSAPRRLRALAAPGLPTAEGVALRWQPPLHPRGDILEYVVRVRALPEGDLWGRDYCVRPPQPSLDDHNIDEGGDETTTAVAASTATEPTRREDGRRCCSCETPRRRCSLDLYSRYSQSRLLDWRVEPDDLDELDSPAEADEASCLSAGFHRLLHDDLLPRAAATALAGVAAGDAGAPIVDTDADVGPASDDTEAVRVPAGNFSAELRGLSHYSRYVARVEACNDGGRCSPAALITFRTAARREADAVEDAQVVSASWEEVRLQWRGPAAPNGALLAYNVEWGRGDQRVGHQCQPVMVSGNQSAAWEEYTLKGLRPGEFWVRVASITLAGLGPYCDHIPFTVPPPAADKSGNGAGIGGGGSGDGGGNYREDGPGGRAGASGGSDSASNTTRTALTAVGVAAALLAVGAGATLLLWWRCLAARRDVLLATVNPEYISLAKYVPDEWEVSRDKVTLVRELATGSFGKVYEGVLMPCGERCAVKTVSERATARERLEFLHEANVMKRFTGAHHVVRLLGVVSRGQPPLVLMELMHRGDLKGFLRAAREPAGEERALFGGHYQDGLPLGRVLRMAAEIADGMAYLEAVKFVHRDLAARNCMVAQDLTVKIGDFGMTRDVYENDYYRKSNKGLLPVRWMAPESLHDGVFSSLSDVWSYGVVLWEISTLAEQPYQGLSNEQVLSYVLGGGRLPRPPDAAPAVWAVCQACWQTSPALRPTFLQLVRSLDSLGGGLGPDFAEVSFYHSEAAVALGDGADTVQRSAPPTVYGFLPPDLDETLF